VNEIVVFALKQRVLVVVTLLLVIAAVTLSSANWIFRRRLG